MTNRTDVSVVMINYNTYELTRNALNSIFAETHDLAYEIVLVDNQSPDGSGERLAEEFGEKIRYFQAGENLGTSKAFNLGMKNSCGRYILWLNTDILIKENFIGKLYRFMEGHPDCGVCGGNVVDFNGNPSGSYSRSNFDAKYVRRNFSVFHRIYRKVFAKFISFDYNYTGKPLRVASVNGADMMIRRAVIDEIGGLEEDIFMYAEEIEFAYRMRKNTAYNVYSVPDAVMYHLEGGSFLRGGGKGFNETRYRILVQGDTTCLRKCFGEKEVLKYLKQKNRSYLKLTVFSKLCRKKSICDEVSGRRKIIAEYLKEIRAKK